MAFDASLLAAVLRSSTHPIAPGCASQRFSRTKLFAHARFKNCAFRLGQGVFQALCGFLQLALEGFDLLGYIIKLLPG